MRLFSSSEWTELQGLLTRGHEVGINRLPTPDPLKAAHRVEAYYYMAFSWNIFELGSGPFKIE